MAEGRHEFGHIYFRMKSWALWDDQTMPISLQSAIKRDVLVAGVTAFWKRGGADNCGRIGRFQGEVDQLEVLFIVLETKIRAIIWCTIWTDPYVGTNVFEHFDAHECVEGMFEMGWDVSVVHQMNPDKSFQAGSFNPLFRKGFLLDGKREAVDLATIFSSGLE